MSGLGQKETYSEIVSDIPFGAVSGPTTGGLQILRLLRLFPSRQQTFRMIEQRARRDYVPCIFLLLSSVINASRY